MIGLHRRSNLLGKLCALIFGIFFAGQPTTLLAVDPPHWIVVTAPAFKDAVAPLVAHRRQEKMRVSVVVTTDVLSAEQIKGGDAAPLQKRIAQLCGESKGERYVLLVGLPLAPGVAQPQRVVVPALAGTVGRMKGQPADNAYSCLGKNMLPDVAVGRLPARSAEELSDMIRKQLAFEQDNSAAPWRNQMTILVGDPGGNTQAQKMLSDMVVGGMIRSQLGKIDPAWSLRVLVHAPSSEFYVPNDQLRPVSLEYLQQGQVFCVYMGHSNATGLWSADVPFISRDDWAQLKLPRGAGVLFTCGCFSCQLQGPEGEGYGLAAIRNPAGPVAVLGAHGESYAIAGKLAVTGLQQCLNRAPPPQRLGEYLLALKNSMANEPVDAWTFWLFDQGDGSGGKVPLEEQRREHLEMWMLLGDPALKLPIRSPTLPLTITGDAAAGQPLTIRCKLPPELAGAQVQVTIERPAGSLAPELQPLPADPAKANAITLAKHKLANNVVIAAQDVAAGDGQFTATFTLPPQRSYQQLIVRAIAVTASDSALGVARVKIRHNENGK